MSETISKADLLWVKYSTCNGLKNFLKGCIVGCRNQWHIVRRDNETVATSANNDLILFNRFLYAFCQNQV